MTPFSPGDPAAVRMREAAAKDALGHALLFTGGGDLSGAARYAAAALECTAAEGKPCGACPACRKVFTGIHPDVVTVRDPEHKTIAVDVVRTIRADAYIRPNEGRRKVYLFPDCALLTEADQNVLLKVVEEGPPYSAFLFCAENAGQVLRTLRSRCVEVRPLAGGDAPPPPERSAVLEALAGGRRDAVTRALVLLEREKPSREELADLLEGWRTSLAAALAMHYGVRPRENCREAASSLAEGLTKAQIMGTIEIMEKYRRECGFNIGTGHVLGALAVELEGIL